ncbi:MAG: zinc ribbon domain-containing protein [Bacteroidales bacterium]|nr:zinc ribbon domain-containing protein [Bacteroidales bacterium]
MKYCTNCGAQLQDDAKFCTNCGTPQEEAAKKNTPVDPVDSVDEPRKEEEKVPDEKYEGDEIKLCNDGVYRWVYKLNMVTNPIILLTVMKIFFWIMVGMLLVFGVIPAAIHGNWGEILEMGKVLLIVLAGMLVLTFISIVILNFTYGGSYCVLFEMDENQIKHIQMPKQYKKAQLLGMITAMTGAARGNLSTTGIGILSASKQSSTSTYSVVRRIKPLRCFKCIKVHEPFEHNQIYVPKKDFDFVYNYIKSRCPKVKK